MLYRHLLRVPLLLTYLATRDKWHARTQTKDLLEVVWLPRRMSTPPIGRSHRRVTWRLIADRPRVPEITHKR